MFTLKRNMKRGLLSVFGLFFLLPSLHVFPQEAKSRRKEIHFSNNEFEKYIRKRPDTGEEGPIYQRELKSISSIKFYTNQETVDLSDLKHFTHIKRLKIRGNGDITERVTSIDTIRGLENLEKLSLRRLNLENISDDLLTDMKNLKELNLGDNNLSDLSFLSGVKSLKRLVLYDNEIQSIDPLSSFDGLRVLKLQKNNIRDISPLKSLRNLAHLDLSNNDIENIELLKNLKKINFLALSNNGVKDIEFITNLPNLKILNLTMNNIQDMKPLKELKKLKYLFISSNPVGELIKFRSSLQILKIDNTNIRDLSPLKDEHKLKKLYLDAYNFDDLSPLYELKNIEMIMVKYHKSKPAPDTYKMWENFKEKMKEQKNTVFQLRYREYDKSDE